MNAFTLNILTQPHHKAMARIAFTAVTVLSAYPAHATDEGVRLSLNTTIQMAVERAPLVQARLLRAQAAQDDAVRAGRLPDPGLTAGINNLTATGPQAFDVGADFMTMRTVGVMQEIPAPAKRAAAKAVATAGVELAGSLAVQTRLAVKRAAADAWVELWAVERKRELLRDLRQQSGLAVKITKARLKGGTGSATEVLAATAAAAKLDTRMVAVEAEIAAARAALRRWIGERADGVLARAPDFSALPVAATRLQRNLDQQAPLLGWSAREEQAQARLALAKAGKRPDWSVSLMYGERVNLPDMASIQVGVSLPIFAGNRQDRDISARSAELAAVQADHEAALRTQRAALAASIATWKGNGQQVTTYRAKLLPLADDRSRTALALYRGGGSLQSWLDARREQIDTRIAYTTTLAAWGSAWVQLAFLIPDTSAALTHTLQEPLR